MPSGTGRFRRSDRLLLPRDYRRVSATGARRASRNFVMLMAPARSDTSGPVAGGRVKLGITASRKVGNAVARNRVKRSVREWFRGERRGLPGADVVVIARRGAASLTGLEVGEELHVLAAAHCARWGEARRNEAKGGQSR